MKKGTIILITAIVIIAVVVIVVAVVMNQQKEKTKLGPINNIEDLTKIFEKVYEGQEDKIPSVVTEPIDTTDDNLVNMMTGLTNGKDLEYLAVSQPMIGSQAYSFVLAKVKDGVDASKIAKDMLENIDTARWVCVYAEKVYATNSGDVVCLVMSSEEWAKPIYDRFKEVAGSIGEEYKRTEQEPVPDDFNGFDEPINALDGIE